MHHLEHLQARGSSPQSEENLQRSQYSEPRSGAIAIAPKERPLRRIRCRSRSQLEDWFCLASALGSCLDTPSPRALATSQIINISQ